MIKQLKKWGNGLAIYFDSDDIKRFGLRINDKIDLSDMFLTETKVNKEKNTYKKLPKNQTMEQIKSEVTK